MQADVKPQRGGGGGVVVVVVVVVVAVVVVVKARIKGVLEREGTAEGRKWIFRILEATGLMIRL